MRRATLTAIVIAAGLASCASPGGPPPSLLPRPAEAIDPRLPVEGPVNNRPVAASLAARLSELVSQAREGDAAFRPLAERADQLAASAGPPQSEGWVAAQQALSAAIAARGPTTRAMGDIDALGSSKLQTQGGLSPADLAAVQNAGNEVGAIDERQARTIRAIQERLGI